jgi:hypothetical protein
MQGEWNGEGGKKRGRTGTFDGTEVWLVQLAGFLGPKHLFIESRMCPVQNITAEWTPPHLLASKDDQLFPHTTDPPVPFVLPRSDVPQPLRV